MTLDWQRASADPPTPTCRPDPEALFGIWEYRLARTVEGAIEPLGSPPRSLHAFRGLLSTAHALARRCLGQTAPLGTQKGHRHSPKAMCFSSGLPAWSCWDIPATRTSGGPALQQTQRMPFLLCRGRGSAGGMRKPAPARAVSPESPSLRLRAAWPKWRGAASSVSSES